MKVQLWATNQVLDLCDQRRQLKQQKYTSTEAGLEHRKMNREVRKKMKAAKEGWAEEQCKNTEKLHKSPPSSLQVTSTLLYG